MTVPQNAVIADGILQELTFDLDFTPSPGSAVPVNSAGLDRYEVKGFLSENQFGTVKVAAAVVTLTPAQDSMDVTDSVTSTFSGLEVTLDLTGVSCAGGIYTHFCAELEPSLEASKVWKQSDDAIKIGCFPICCAGESYFKPIKGTVHHLKYLHYYRNVHHNTITNVLIRLATNRNAFFPFFF